MDFKTILRIQIITLTDSICFGLIYAFINPYILIIGGDHVTVGIFSVVNLLCQLYSDDINRILAGHAGKEFALFLVSVIATISHLLITLTNSYWFVISSRCLFTLTNVTNSLCKNILLKKIPNDETGYFLTIHNVLSACGYIIGPIITGYLFPYGFNHSCLLAAVLQFSNVLLSRTITVEDDEDIEPEKSVKDKVAEDIDVVCQNFKKADLHQNWDMVALKFLFASSTTIFFTKFTQILIHNFNSNPLTIGFTSAYMNGLSFACQYLASDKGNVKITLLSLTRNCFCSLLLSLLFICYVPFYSLYLLLCIPLILSRCYLNATLGILFTIRNNEALIKLNYSVGIIAGLIVPIVFGIVCNKIGHHAVILFSIVPVIFSLMIFYSCTSNCLVENEKHKSKDE